MEKIYAGGFLYNPKKNEVLLHKRDGDTTINPNKWAFFGGLAEGDETPQEAFVREIQEELSIVIQESEVHFLYDYMNTELGTHRYIFYIESEKQKSEMVLTEGADFDWVSLKSVFSYDLTQRAVWDLKTFLKRIQYSRDIFDMKKIHFVGIGGIGMSALAQFLHEQGVVVTGSDREESPVTELLEKKGIRVAIGQKSENVADDSSLVVYSDAVPPENSERMRAQELSISQKSYFEALGEISIGKRTVAVAGTHGKTTTTGMLAKILKDADASPTAIVGSIVKDFGSNYLAGTSDLFVVEACEYRDHLLELFPQVLVITNLEWDHTDYFPSLEALQESFKKAIERVPADGFIVTDPRAVHIAPLLKAARAKVVDYTMEPSFTLLLPGEFNRMNARAAAAAARVILQKISEDQISQSLSSFQGTWRRFEYKGKTVKGADVYDDYAHHPTAVRVTLKALRAKTRKATPCGKIIAVFHPHLYSRTRDLLAEFATAFSDANQVFIAPIYAAREIDDGTVSSEILAERITAAGTNAIALESFGAIEKVLRKFGKGDTIITMGAGDIYKVADALVAHI